ncbi:MAG: hypothetical protein UW65_C0014G0001 [candidate division WWE3 bacterium GW2011_GWB1_44_4]|uniref:DNA-directed DNA polymerase n=1 Tax=candidate division WWE3 bacterium GW2011_GWB1_44_4 TaxID=1619116 RepID=A0A0G1JEC4_UNCKA|nr:MAG: hypothetical protein UW65_C0014G0001 [candidate division WWE3 bacterium GW2011_GWB1_44_4]
MLTLTYGTNQIAIRNLILGVALQHKTSAIKDYNVDSDPLSTIETTLQTGIFGEKTLNVLNVSKITKPQTEKLFDLLKKYTQAIIVLVSTKDLEETSPLVKIVRAFKGKVVPATLARPNQVFKYLDDVYCKREKECYQSLQKLLTVDNDPVYILFMLQYQLRNVALAKFGLQSKLSPFQVAQAKKQAQNFTEHEITHLYGVLFDLDVKLKTGTIAPDSVPVLATSKILSM